MELQRPLTPNCLFTDSGGRGVRSSDPLKGSATQQQSSEQLPSWLTPGHSAKLPETGRVERASRVSVMCRSLFAFTCVCLVILQ